MMVVEGVGVIRGVKADECTPTIVVGEIELRLTGCIGVPVYQGGTETRLGQFIGGSIA